MRRLKEIKEKPEMKALYRRRKSTVEPVFGQIKCGMGFRRYLYRGLSSVRSEWNLVCAAFNLKKMAALLQKKESIESLEGIARENRTTGDREEGLGGMQDDSQVESYRTIRLKGYPFTKDQD